MTGRRRSLPNGRAMLGAFLVAVAAVIVFAAVLTGAGGRPGHSFVVAAEYLRPGSVIEPGDLSTESIRLPADVASGAFSDPSSLVGSSLAVPVSRGELLEASMLSATGKSARLRPVTVGVDSPSLAGLVAGEPVDVLEAAGGQGTQPVNVVMRGATVLAISRSGSGLLSSQGASTVTLGVSTLDEAEAVVAAGHAGTMTLIAAEPSDGVGLGTGTGSGTGGGTGNGTGTASGGEAAANAGTSAGIAGNGPTSASSGGAGG